MSVMSVCTEGTHCPQKKPSYNYQLQAIKKYYASKRGCCGPEQALVFKDDKNTQTYHKRKPMGGNSIL